MKLASRLRRSRYGVFYFRIVFPRIFASILGQPKFNRIIEDHPRLTINRNLILTLPKQVFLDWIMRVDFNPPELMPEQLWQEQDGYLVSEKTIELVEDAQLKQWFDIQCHPMLRALFYQY
ncbi:MAG TPA: hypothetical protein VGN04_08180 [Herbaspirillum sp.]